MFTALRTLGVASITVASAIALTSCGPGEARSAASDAGESRPRVDAGDSGSASTFQDDVLADAVVTRAELEQAYDKLLDCYRDAGLDGAVWIDLDLSSSYALMLSDPDAGEDRSGRVEQVMATCEASYIDRIQRAYAQQALDDPATIERKRRLILGCLEDRLPEVYARLPQSGPLDELRAAAYRELESNEAAGPVVQLCVEQYGMPMQDLATVTVGARR